MESSPNSIVDKYAFVRTEPKSVTHLYSYKLQKVGENYPPNEVQWSTLVEKNRLKTYIEGCNYFTSFRGFSSSIINPKDEIRGGLSLHTDGIWVFTRDIGFLYEKYDVILPSLFVKHIRGRNYNPLFLDGPKLDQLMDHYFGPDDDGLIGETGIVLLKA